VKTKHTEQAGCRLNRRETRVSRRRSCSHTAACLGQPHPRPVAPRRAAPCSRPGGPAGGRHLPTLPTPCKACRPPRDYLGGLPHLFLASSPGRECQERVVTGPADAGGWGTRAVGLSSHLPADVRRTSAAPAPQRGAQQEGRGARGLPTLVFNRSQGALGKFSPKVLLGKEGGYSEREHGEKVALLTRPTAIKPLCWHSRGEGSGAAWRRHLDPAAPNGARAVVLLRLDLRVRRARGAVPPAPTTPAPSPEARKGPFAAPCQHQPRAAQRAAGGHASLVGMVACRHAGSVQNVSRGKPIFEDCLDEGRQTLRSPAWEQPSNTARTH